MGFRLLKIGRTPLGNDDQPNDIQVDHPTVSRSHLSVFINDEDEVFITDLDSANGTYVNGNRITGDYQLKQGDILKLGMAPPIRWSRWLEESIEELQASENPKQTGEENSDFTKTAVPVPKKKSKAFVQNLLIGLLFLLVAGGVITYIFIGKKTPSSPPKPVVYSFEEIKQMDIVQIKKLAEKKDSVLNVLTGEIKLKDGKTYILTVEKNRLIKVDEMTIAVQPSPKEEEPAETIIIKDRDKDGIADEKDKCPDDPKNKCERKVVETNEDKTNDVPVVPRDIRSLGDGFYSTQVMSGGESVPAFHRRISGRNDILSLGTRRTISTQDQIIDINHFQYVEGYIIERGTWVKFKVY